MLLYLTKHSYDETKVVYQERIKKLSDGENTPIKLQDVDGNAIILPARLNQKFTVEGINILTRQAFVMFYGSFETYLFQLFEKSYPEIGVTDDILKRSIKLLMGGEWDSKLNKISSTFGLNFKARELNKHFENFELNFEGTSYHNPLHFMDKLALVRHRIVHASSLLENNKLISFGLNIFHSYYGYYFLLTDFVDLLFSRKFDYSRLEITPAEA